MARRARREISMQQWRAAVLTSALLALTPTPSLAAPVACSPGTLTDYVTLGDGCTVGGFLFDNFTLGTTLPTGATPISPDVVEVTPVPSGLAFGVDVTADAGELLEILFGYDVSHPAIAGARLAMSGASATGDAAVTAVKNFCERRILQSRRRRRVHRRRGRAHRLCDRRRCRPRRLARHLPVREAARRRG